MPNSPAEAVRRRIADGFAQLGWPMAQEPRETVLIRAGAFFGRRFSVDDGYAIWFASNNELKFYRADGKLVRDFELIAPEGRRLAA